MAGDAPDEVSPRRRLHPAVRYTALALIVAFFVWFLWNVDWKQLGTIEFDWRFIVVALVLSLAFRVAGVFIWRAVLRGVGAVGLPSIRILASVYARAWMGRYVPGKVTWIGGKVLFASEYGISRSKLTVSSLVEAGSQLVGVGTVSLILLTVDGRLADVAPSFRIIAVATIVVLALGLLPPVFNRVVKIAMRVLKRGELTEARWRTVAAAIGRYSVAFIGSGGANALLAYAVASELGPRDFPYLMGAFGIAAVLGMAALFAPAGLGVRDGIQLLLLSVVVAQPVALVIVVLSRVHGAVAVVLFWLFAELARPRRNANEPA